jgi:hypothetical protein
VEVGEVGGDEDQTMDGRDRGDLAVDERRRAADAGEPRPFGRVLDGGVGVVRKHRHEAVDDVEQIPFKVLPSR